MKKLSTLLLVLGFVVVVLGLAFPYSSDARMYCLQFRQQAVDYSEQAIQAKGTPREAEFMEESETQTLLADDTCALADEKRLTAMMLGGGGLLLLVIGFALRPKKVVPPAA